MAQAGGGTPALAGGKDMLHFRYSAHSARIAKSGPASDEFEVTDGRNSTAANDPNERSRNILAVDAKAGTQQGVDIH
jgi:hypothetical protein